MSVLACFILMALALAIPAAQCAYHLGSRPADGKGTAIPALITEERDGREQPSEIVPNMERMETILNQILLGLLVVLICMGGSCLFLLTSIAGPIHRMANAAKAIADGRLDATAPSIPRNEIGQTGASINELAVNLQEVLLHVWHHTSHATTLLGRTEPELAAGGSPSRSVQKNLEEIRRNIQDVQALVRTFDCYDISLEEGRIESARSSRGEHPSGGPDSRQLRWDLDHSN